MSDTNKGCSNLTILTDEEYDAELQRLGLTRRGATRATTLELRIEVEMGRIRVVEE